MLAPPLERHPTARTCGRGRAPAPTATAAGRPGRAVPFGTMTAPIDPIAHMRAHRSIRRYRPDPVADDVLDRILESALRASSSGNMQSYSIVVTRDPALRERLHTPHMGQDMVLEAPVLLTFCSDFHRMRRWLALSEAADGFDDPFAFAVGAIDAALASQNAALAAEAEGLGICYLGSTLANADAIAEILELPPHVVPVVGFVLGHPAEEPTLRDRLPLEGLVHFETYRDPDDDEVRSTYRERETAGWARYMANPELRARIEASGVRNLAQVYSELKYTRADHEVFTANLTRVLRKQGFLPT